MAFTKDKTIRYGCRVWYKLTDSTDPAKRKLNLLTSVKLLTRTRTGVGLPTYKRVISSAGNATTSANGIFSSLENQRFRVHLDYDKADGFGLRTEEVYGDTAHYLGEPVFNPYSSIADARAAAKFLAEIRKAAVLMSGPTFLGELRQTKRMLSKPAAALWESMSDYLNNVKRANQNNRKRYFRKEPARYARNLGKIASGLWLEKSFGWDPLMHDIADARNAFDSLIELDRVAKVSSGAQDAKLSSSITLPQLMVSGSHLWMRSVQRHTHHTTVRYRGAVRVQAATTYTDRFARFGFTPSEFIPTAWELLPWSFLIDYFTNIGEILSASVTDTSALIWSAKSTILKSVKMAYWIFDTAEITKYIPVTQIKNLTGSSGLSKWSRSSWSRNASTVDVPSIYFTLPFSDKQLFNCAALMDQVGIDMNPQRLRRRNYRL